MLLILLLENVIYAQDVIVKKDGNTILVKVLEISEDCLKYKKFSNLDGPTYLISMDNLLSVNYENGEKDVFSNNTIKPYKDELPLTVWNEQDEKENAQYLESFNNHPYTYIGKVDKKKAKWQYCIVKMHDDSKCKDANLEVGYSIRTTYYEKFNGRKVLDSEIYFTLKNVSDKIVYVDLANSFFRRGSVSSAFFANSSTTVTNGSQIGASVNAGVVADAVGIGGVVGDIANGVNVGGCKSSSSSVTIYEQRVIAIAPFSEYKLPECVFYQSAPFYKVDSDCNIGDVEKFKTPSSIAQTAWGDFNMF